MPAIAVQIVEIPRAGEFQPAAAVAPPADIEGPPMTDEKIARPILDTFRHLLRVETDPEMQQTIRALIGETEAKMQRNGNSAWLHSLGSRGWGRDS